MPALGTGTQFRVAVVTETFPATSETFIVRQVRWLGADVVTTQVNQDILAGIDLPGAVISVSRGKSLKGGASKRSLARLRRLCRGYRVPSWPKWVAQNWEGYLRDRKPDVVLAHFAQNAMRCQKGCATYAVPLVVHFHGFDVSVLPRHKAYRDALGRLFEQAEAVIAVSEMKQKQLHILGCPPAKLHRIPCGVPVDEFPLGDSQAQNPCQFLAVGRFAPVKGPLFTLRAFSRCVAQCPGTRLVMIGGGPLLAKARRWVRTSQCTDKIELMGPQPIEVVRECMAGAGCFVQHSITAPAGDVEGWPVALAEAEATGLPVIATRHGGILEQVIDGQTGYLVDEGDWQAMAGRMIELAQNPQLRREMGLAGRRHIEAHGNFEVQIRRLADVLQNAACAPA